MENEGPDFHKSHSSPFGGVEIGQHDFGFHKVITLQQTLLDAENQAVAELQAKAW